MTHERDLDHMLDRWMDAGPTVVSDRVIAAAMTDVHTTRQRGARWASLKELFMTMKPAMTVLGLAAAAVVTLAAFQILSGGGVGAPRVLTPEDLPTIIANPDNVTGVESLDRVVEGETAALTPMRSTFVVELDGWVDGLTHDMCGDDGCLEAWVALFDSEANAEAAFDFYLAEFESGAWAIPASKRSEPDDLGDEAVLYSDVVNPGIGGGPSGPLLDGIYFWRVDNLLLAVVGVSEFDGEALRAIADDMAARAMTARAE
jgi:hypothetical protein